MIHKMTQKWQSLTDNEKRAVSVLLVLIIAPILFMMGVRIGEVLFLALN